jgi:oligopeptide transport system substrate-binding protein
MAACWLLAAGTVVGEVVIHRGNSTEPDSIDPQLALSWQDWNIVTDLFVGLTTLDGPGNTIPGMAHSWSSSEDGLTWTFEIHEGLEWSDGTPLNAHDFVYSFRRLLDPETAASRISEYYAIENAQAINYGQASPDTLGVRAVDDTTLEISLAWPIPHLPQMLAWTTGAPVPRHVVEEHGQGWTAAGVMVSNGPYVLAEWEPYGHVKLVRNRRFFEADGVSIDTVYFYPADDGATNVRRIRSGELDTNYGIVPEQLELARRELKDEMRAFARPVTMFLAFNLQTAPFDDIRVRKALSMALDREIIVREVLKTGDIPAYDIVPPGIDNYGDPQQPEWAAWPMKQRRETAQALLAEAGFDRSNPLAFTLRYDGAGTNKRVCIVVAGMWRQVGVRASLQTTDTKVHFADLKAGNFDIGRLGISGKVYSAETVLQIFEDNQPRVNPGRYSNTQFTSLMNEARRSPDRTERGQLMRRASAIVMNDYAVAPMYYYVSRSLVQTYVKGWYANPYDVQPTRFMRIERPATN